MFVFDLSLHSVSIYDAMRNSRRFLCKVSLYFLFFWGGEGRFNLDWNVVTNSNKNIKVFFFKSKFFFVVRELFDRDVRT